MINWKKNKSVIIAVVTITIILAIISYFAYDRYVRDMFTSNNYITNTEFKRKANALQDVNLIFFYTEWCPHSQTALKIWKEFKAGNNNRVVNSYQVRMKEVDCDKDEETANQYNITGYPTIKLVKSENEIIEFDAKPEMETLRSFLNTTLH